MGSELTEEELSVERNFILFRFCEDLRTRSAATAAASGHHGEAGYGTVNQRRRQEGDDWDFQPTDGPPAFAARPLTAAPGPLSSPTNGEDEEWDKPDAAEPRLLGAHPLDANQSTRGTPKEVRELPGPNSRRELGVLAGVALPIPGRPTYPGRGSRRGRRWRGRGLEEAKPFSSALPR